jgi:hypothetical protein
MSAGGLHRSPEDGHSAGLNFPKPEKNRAISPEYESRFITRMDRELSPA